MVTLAKDQNEGFNEYGFRDVELPASLRQLGNKKLKISQYCPKYNQKSESKSDAVFTTLNMSSKVGDTWQNLSFDFDDLELLGIRLPRIVACLSHVGGANDGTEGKAEGQEVV